MNDVRQQVIAHLQSMCSAGILFLPKITMPQEFRRCLTCSHTSIAQMTPHTAVPCPKCNGEMLAAPVTIKELIAERERCANALEALAAKCELHAGPDGKVTAAGAATHMRNLAVWMRIDHQ